MGEAVGYISTTNACKVCTPLGATLVFKGVRGALPFLHGSQGCATYMRRYLISHFRESMDIASSALGENQAVFGGGDNLKAGLDNVIEKYDPELVGIATTCLTETIGDDVPHLMGEYRKERSGVKLPALVNVSTPSYQGSHMEGFHATVKALVDQLAVKKGEARTSHLNLFPGMVSTADLRHLREVIGDFGLTTTILPDYSDTLDGPAVAHYEPISPGGTSVEEIEQMGSSAASMELGRVIQGTKSAADLLETRFDVQRHPLGLPIGLRESDRFFDSLEDISSNKTPAKYAAERGRLVDAYVDGHKYLSGKRAVVYGDEDMVVGLVSFLTEIGIQPVLCATGSKSKKFKEQLATVAEGLNREPMVVMDDVDFYQIADLAKEAAPDLVIGNSKGHRIARDLGVPLVRVGFPIHDRFGGQRVLHLGYRGAQTLYDTIVNAIMERKQEDSSVGYGYL